MSLSQEIWSNLSSINVSKHTEKKGKFTYLSWTWAWATLMEHYPDATVSYKEPVFYPDSTVEVWCSITITKGLESVTREMWLPVMDFKNNSKASPTSREISDTRMRCLVKCLAMFGLGHYIYAGEDLPDIKPEFISRDDIGLIRSCLDDNGVTEARLLEVGKLKVLSDLTKDRLPKVLEIIPNLRA